MVCRGRPTRRFLQVILSLLNQDRVRLLRRNDPSRHFGGSRETIIGWFDERSLYLLQDAAYEAVSRFCKECGEVFPLRQERLSRELHEEGLSERDSEHFTVVEHLGGKARRVISLYRGRVEKLVGEQFPCDDKERTTTRTRTRITLPVLPAYAARGP